MIYFEEIGVKRLVDRYVRNLEVLVKSNEPETPEKNESFTSTRDKAILLILRSIQNAPSEWDASCPFNIQHISGHLSTALSEDAFTNEGLDDVFSVLFRFLMERYISTPDEFISIFQSVRHFAIARSNEFSADAKVQIEYAIREMPIGLFKMVMNGESMQSIKTLHATIANIDNLRKEWDAELKLKTDEVNALRDALDKQTIAFNFVGLYEGFNTLSNIKRLEIFRSRILVGFLAMLVISPLLFEIYRFIKADSSNLSLVHYASVIPIISITIIFIYFFRISLQSLNSSKAQRDQIELRKTLCTFIQHYVRYSAEIKKDDPDSLTKFENIIFSNILPNGNDIPSAYDGIEQLAKLITSVKSSKS